MQIVDYASLQAAIITYAWRDGDTEFAASVPTFIGLAEKMFNRRLRLRDQEKTVGLTLVDGETPLPADYLQYRSLLTNSAYPVSLEGRPNSGCPFTFTISGDFIISTTRRGDTVILSYEDSVPPDQYVFGVGEDLVGDFTFNYFAAIPALSDAAPTNWLLTKAPDVYLYGSLLQAEPFMRDDARMQTWATMLDGSLKDLQRADAISRYPRAVMRVRGPTP